MPVDPINNDARERARAALGGARPARPVKAPAVGGEVKLDLPPAEVSKRRETARASMEGYERRERRKMQEAKAAAELAQQKKLAADLEARRQAAAEAVKAKSEPRPRQPPLKRRLKSAVLSKWLGQRR